MTLLFMQPASGDFTLSPVTSRSRHEYRRLDSFTTRRLSAAIDTLRHEGEAILWEMNSLRTQILTMEQRIIGQTEELDTISRSLAALREQHRVMEQQYQEKLRVLRSELDAAQEGQPSTAQSSNPSASECERRRSLSFRHSPQPFGNQDSHQHLTPQPLPLSVLPDTQVPATGGSHRDHTGYMVDDRDTADAVPSRNRSVAFRHSATPPPLRPATLLQSPFSHSPYDTQRRSPQGTYKQSRTRPHDGHDPQRYDAEDVASSPTRHETSLSPTLVGSCSDAPSRSRSRKHDHKF